MLTDNEEDDDFRARSRPSTPTDQGGIASTVPVDPPSARPAHTPGPWRATSPMGTWIETVGDPYGHGVMHIADVRGWGHLTGAGACSYGEPKAIAIQEANARLIAAAPELLAALKGLEDAALTYGVLHSAETPDDDAILTALAKQLEAMRVALAVIAKAEGR